MAAPLYVYVSSSSGSDTANNGKSAASPLATAAKARALYGKANLNRKRVFRFACGDVFRENNISWTFTDGYEAAMESYEIASGDTELLGRPKFSAGTLLTTWTADAGNWYTTDVTLLPQGSGPLPVEQVNWVLLMDYVVQKRRDGRVLAGDPPSGYRQRHNGVFTAGTLGEGEWGFQLSTGRIYVGSDPTGRTVEINSAYQPIWNLYTALNLRMEYLWMACAPVILLMQDEDLVTPTNRTLTLSDLILTGASRNVLQLGGGDNVKVERIHASYASGSVCTFNDGVQGHMLVKDSTFYCPPEYGEGPNGYYDDRCGADAFTLHSDGGGTVTVDNLDCSGACENAIDVLEGYDEVRIRNSRFYNAAQYVGVFNSKTIAKNSRFYDSGWGVSLSYHGSLGPTLNAAGSHFDHCLIVNNGAFLGRAQQNTCGLRVVGLGPEYEPVRITRSVISSHPTATAPFVLHAPLKWTSGNNWGTGDDVTYGGGELLFSDTILDHRATGTAVMFKMGTATTAEVLPVSSDDLSLVRCTLQRANEDADLATVNEVAMGAVAFMVQAVNSTSSLGSVTWPTEPPTEPSHYLANPALVDDLALALLSYGPGDALVNADVSSTT